MEISHRKLSLFEKTAYRGIQLPDEGGRRRLEGLEYDVKMNKNERDEGDERTRARTGR